MTKKQPETMNPALEIELYDQEKEKHHSVRIAFDEHGIYITPKGYGDYYSNDGDGIPIMVEVFGGEPRVILWNDINKQDSTHIIGLKNAKETCRKNEDGTVKMSSNELDKLRNEKIDEIFENYDLQLGEDDEFEETDGWEHISPGNEYWRGFYVIWSNADESKRHIFTVQFKPGSVEVESAGPDY